MRSRLLFAVVASLVSLTRVVHGQEDRLAGGLQAGDYARLSGGITTPVNPQGSVRDWDRGTGVSVAWENWQTGGTGVGRVGLGFALSYAFLPLNESKFITDFTPLEGGKATAATAGKAGLLELGTVLRFRIPAPLVMPTINVGVGFINWRPADVHYTGTAGSGTSKQRHRSGAEVSIGGGLERHIVDRFGLFADAVYVYGFTGLGRSSATPGGFCATTGCDVLKNTSATSLRGGLSVRVR